MLLDKDKYRPDLAGLGLTTEQEDQILECLWNITEEFTAAAFGRHPVQMAQKERRRKADSGQDSAPVIQSGHSGHIDNFRAIATARGKYKGDK